MNFFYKTISLLVIMFLLCIGSLNIITSAENSNGIEYDPENEYLVYDVTLYISPDYDLTQVKDAIYSHLDFEIDEDNHCLFAQSDEYNYDQLLNCATKAFPEQIKNNINNSSDNVIINYSFDFKGKYEFPEYASIKITPKDGIVPKEKNGESNSDVTYFNLVERILEFSRWKDLNKTVDAEKNVIFIDFENTEKQYIKRDIDYLVKDLTKYAGGEQFVEVKTKGSVDYPTINNTNASNNDSVETEKSPTNVLLICSILGGAIVISIIVIIIVKKRKV